MTWAFQPLLPAAAELLGPPGQGGDPGFLPSIGLLFPAAQAAALASAASAACAATANLTTSIPLAAAASAVATITPTIDAGIGHAGNPAFLPSIGLNFPDAATGAAVRAVVTISPTLTTSIPLGAGIAAVSSIGAIDINTTIALVASAQAITDAAADLTAISNKIEPQRGWVNPVAWFVDPGWSALYWPTVQGMPPQLAGSAVLSLLNATPAAVTTITPDLQTAIRFTAAPAVVCVVTATALNVGASLSASGAAVSTVTPSLTTAIALETSVTGACSVSCTLFDPANPSQLAATISCRSTVTANMDVTAIPMASVAVGQTTLTAEMAALIALEVIAQARVSAAAQLTTDIEFVASTVGRVTARADFNYNVRPIHDGLHRIGGRKEHDERERIGRRIGHKHRIG